MPRSPSTRLLGWEAREPGREHRYMIVSAKSKGVGGVTGLPEGMSQPFSMGYVGTPDIDAALTRLTGAGGAVHRGPWDIPEVGRLALVTDPQGAGLALIQGAATARAGVRPGRPATATGTSSHDRPGRRPRVLRPPVRLDEGRRLGHGPTGTYQLIEADGARIGGVMRATEPPGRRGSTISASGAPSAPSRGSRPAAGRSCTDRARSRAARSSSRRGTRRAPRSRSSVRRSAAALGPGGGRP